MRLSSDCCTDGSAVRLGRDEEVNQDCNIVRRAGGAVGLHCSCQRPGWCQTGWQQSISMALLQEHKREWLIIDFEDEEVVYVMDVDMVGPLIQIIS